MTHENFKNGQIDQTISENRKKDLFVGLSFDTDENPEIKGEGLCTV